MRTQYLKTLLICLVLISLTCLCVSVNSASVVVVDKKINKLIINRRDTSHDSPPADSSHQDHSTSGDDHSDHAASGEEHEASEDSEHGQEHESEHDQGHDSGHGGGHGGEGGHHAPPTLSHQLQLHMLTYKPETFKMFTYPVGIDKVIVGFNYTEVSQYDRFLMRIRYHGYEEYTTAKMRLFRNESNQLLLKGFYAAQYIVCVTLLTATGLPEYAPISTSDMCIDVLVGEAHPIGGHHSSTGLLSPLLFAVATVLLIIITVGYYAKRSYLNHVKEQQEAKKLIEKYGDREKEEDKKKIKHEFSAVLLNKAAFLKWQGAGRTCEIVENDSSLNLPNLNQEKQREFARSYHVNRGLDMQHDSNDTNLTSVDSLSHVLDDKPWQAYAQDSNGKPVFYFNE